MKCHRNVAKWTTRRIVSLNLGMDEFLLPRHCIVGLKVVHNSELAWDKSGFFLGFPSCKPFSSIGTLLLHMYSTCTTVHNTCTCNSWCPNKQGSIYHIYILIKMRKTVDFWFTCFAILWVSEDNKMHRNITFNYNNKSVFYRQSNSVLNKLHTVLLMLKVYMYVTYRTRTYNSMYKRACQWMVGITLVYIQYMHNRIQGRPYLWIQEYMHNCTCNDWLCLSTPHYWVLLYII